MTAAVDLIAQADRAVASGDLHAAVQMLEQAAKLRTDDSTLWLKIAAMHRGTNSPRKSLQAVRRALALTPRDFGALLMQASLLDSLGDPQAGEAWENALANRPAGVLPPQLANVVAKGEERHATWLALREARMQAAMAAVEGKANADEKKRIERFRSNVLRRTKPYRSSPTHFHYPELSEREFHPRRLFPWLKTLEAATGDIASELKTVMAAERAELVPYIQYDEHLPLDQWKPLNKNSDWTAIHLVKNGKAVAANARHCPKTLGILQQIEQPDIHGAGPNAMFSLLAPGTAIPPHVGVNNTRLVCHLPLVVPEGCWFRVGAETRYWQRGEAFVFDDTIEHEAMNPSSELRIVFIFDLWHPDLSAVERDSVTALIEADGVPANDAP